MERGTKFVPIIGLVLLEKGFKILGKNTARFPTMYLGGVDFRDHVQLFIAQFGLEFASSSIRDLTDYTLLFLPCIFRRSITLYSMIKRAVPEFENNTKETKINHRKW